jgi:hypothetical protein
MQQYNEYSTESNLHWQGLNSSKFPRPRLIHPRKDIIKTGTHRPTKGWSSPTRSSTPLASTLSRAAAASSCSGLG